MRKLILSGLVVAAIVAGYCRLPRLRRTTTRLSTIANTYDPSPYLGLNLNAATASLAPPTCAQVYNRAPHD